MTTSQVDTPDPERQAASSAHFQFSQANTSYQKIASGYPNHSEIGLMRKGIAASLRNGMSSDEVVNGYHERLAKHSLQMSDDDLRALVEHVHTHL
jgi:hypothetical protein